MGTLELTESISRVRRAARSNASCRFCTSRDLVVDDDDDDNEEDDDAPASLLCNYDNTLLSL